MTRKLSTEGNRNRTQEQAVSDQMDCDLDNFVRRVLAQAVREPLAKSHWEKVAKQLENVRGLVRQRMHEADRKATA